MQAHKGSKEQIISSRSHMRKSTNWATIAINHLLDNISIDLWVTKMKNMNQCWPTSKTQSTTTRMDLTSLDHPTSHSTMAKEKKQEQTSIQTLLHSSTYWVCFSDIRFFLSRLLLKKSACLASLSDSFSVYCWTITQCGWWTKQKGGFQVSIYISIVCLSWHGTAMGIQ